MEAIERFRVTAEWSCRPQTLVEVSRLVFDFVREFHLLDQKMTSCCVNAEEFIKFNANSIGFDEIFNIIKRESYRKRNIHQYHNIDSRKQFTADSLSNFGFRVSLKTLGVNGKNYGEDVGGVVIGMRAGAAFPFGSGVVNLNLPMNEYGSFHESAFVARFLDIVSRIWQPVRTIAISSEFEKAAFPETGTPSRHSDRYIWPGWITRLSVPQLESHLPTHLDVELADNGDTLIYASRNRPQADDPGALESARRILAVLDDLCLTRHEVLLNGWPRYRAEDDYAHQISGAPIGHQYRVALADFSGYDPQRGILLWAKLFPYWNADEFAYKPTFATPLESMPVVAEARRQLRSLELVQATNPIEWHIGRQELVEPLRLLLNGHAQIPAERLRVVYTPFDAQDSEGR